MITTIVSNVAGNGAKYVATNLAIACKVINKEKRILLVDFDLENPTLGKVFYNNKRKDSLNIIIGELLKNKNLSIEFLKECMFESSKGIDILIGRNIEEIDYYNTVADSGFECLFESLEKMYDFIFVVINKEPNNKVTIATLLNSDNIIVVGRNNVSNELMLSTTLSIINAYTNNVKKYYITNMYEGEKLSLPKSELLKDYMFLGNLKYRYSSVDNKNLNKVMYAKLSNNNKVFLRTIKVINGGKVK